MQISKGAKKGFFLQSHPSEKQELHSVNKTLFLDCDEPPFFSLNIRASKQNSLSQGETIQNDRLL